MLRQARRTLGATAPGTDVDLRLGAAGRLPFDDDLFDVTMSVNTVVFWPVLAAGLAEMARVARPGSVVMLAWHGGTSPSRIQRRLLLDHDTLTDVAVEMGAHFANVDHKRLRQSELLIASC